MVNNANQVKSNMSFCYFFTRQWLLERKVQKKHDMMMGDTRRNVAV